MYKQLAFFALWLALAPGLAHAACSRANLTRCLDSACAINISTNPAARCQYCGTANAGTPADDGMRSVSVGTSTRYNISAKELKSAPTDPGKRYAWATTKCIALVSGCTADDVSDVYDSLIEQSCTAAGINAQMSSLQSQVAKSKTQSACSAEISTCIMSDTKCTTNFASCKDDTDFNKFFSACASDATGCDSYVSAIRSELVSSRDSMIKNADAIVESIVKSYADARDKRIAAAKATCTNNAGRESCISKMCDERMPNKCAAGFNDEKSMATQLCKFYDTACATLK